MASSWIDYGVVSIIVVGGLFIFYRALKEPVDLLFGALGKGFHAIKDMLSGGPAQQYEEIRYG